MFPFLKFLQHKHKQHLIKVILAHKIKRVCNRSFDYSAFDLLKESSGRVSAGDCFKNNAAMR